MATKRCMWTNNNACHKIEQQECVGDDILKLFSFENYK